MAGGFRHPPSLERVTATQSLYSVADVRDKHRVLHMHGDGVVLNPPVSHDALVLGRLHVQVDADLLLPRVLLLSVCVGVLVLVCL